MRIVAKKYPDNYSNDVMNVIRTMSFTNGRNVKLVGSYTIRNQAYAGDIDALEFVKVRSIADCVKRFQNVVKNTSELPVTFIADIKCGSVDEWKVVPDDAIIKDGRVVGYDRDAILQKVKHLYETKIITENQFIIAKRMLRPTINAVEFLALRKELRYNILRWSLKEISDGYKVLQDGRHYSLAHGVSSPTITKMDVVSWVNRGSFTDFEMIYEFEMKKKIINSGLRDLDIAIKESILLMRREGNYFKMAKRMYALARYYDYKHDLMPLNDLFIGDLGRIYSIFGDANTLKFLIENVNSLPKEKMLMEIDQFTNRLSNVVIPTYLRREKRVMAILKRLRNKEILKHNSATMVNLLDQLRFELYSVLSNYALRYLKQNRLYPLASKYLP